ncbi:hypothetical protein [Capillimicrobium parvum]|uniref:hypothetical protein n=1 Tax=Capillimicrobium parvum TaxID=2884022 RepID=UPI00216AB3A8|nr:hypothetical protein [Capillimicrobium parvum]
MPPEPVGIGRGLAEDRLRHREHRIGQVMRELRARADAHVARGDSVPRPLNQALEGFATELAQVRRALGAHGGAGWPRQRRATGRWAR